MTAAQEIEFYKLILGWRKAVFGLEPRSPEVYSKLNLALQAITNRQATREYVKKAQDDLCGNESKRRWNLKFQYTVALFQQNQKLTIPEVHKQLKDHFNERTRPTVIEAAQRAAQTHPFKDSTIQEILEKIHRADRLAIRFDS